MTASNEIRSCVVRAAVRLNIFRKCTELPLENGALPLPLPASLSLALAFPLSVDFIDNKTRMLVERAHKKNKAKAKE